MRLHHATVPKRVTRPGTLLGCLAVVWLALDGSGPHDASALPRPGGFSGARPVAISPRFTFAPYLQDVSSTSLIVAFSTDVTTTALVRVFEPTTTTDIPDGELSRERTPKAVFLSPPGVHHRVRLTGLLPGIRYSYSVAARRPGDATQREATAPETEFSTAPVRGPFSFLVYGDNRDRDADHAAVVAAMAKEQADLVLQTGDMVSRASDEGQWRRYFHTAAPIMRGMPLYPALGNHELRYDGEATHFHRLFVLPRSAGIRPSPKRRPVYYAFRYSNALFVALDGNSPYDIDQAAWLERTLYTSQADTSLRHTFVFIHQPPFAVGAYCGSERVARRLVPILQRYGVRAVFAGHEHAYQHLEREGLRFFISGGGGAPLYPRSQACNFEDDLALRQFRAEHHFLRVQIDGDAATLYAINQRGDLMERVPLHEPIHDAPPLPPPPEVPVEPPDTSPPRLHEPPLLAMATMAAAPPPPSLVQLPTAQLAIDPLSHHESRRASSSLRSPGSFGPLLLLWLSSVALLAGLFMLVRDLRPRRQGGRQRSASSAETSDSTVDESRSDLAKRSA